MQPLCHLHLFFIACAIIISLSQSLSLSFSSATHFSRRRPRPALLGAISQHHAACACQTRRSQIRPQFSSQLANSLDNGVESASIDQDLLDSLRSMRVKELKSELESLNLSARNALEKEELVQRLYKARIIVTSSGGIDDDGNTTKKKKKKRRRYEDAPDDITVGGTGHAADDTQSNNYNAQPRNTPPPTNGWTITAPFIYHELETSKSVAAQNAENVYLRPSPGKYAAIKVQLKKNGKAIEWTLLVDTACSGLVLSPNAVSRANQQCPGILQTINNAGTMTMAGSSQGTSVAKWDSYTKMMVAGVEINHSNMAACQDIGALPGGLDGILGLSFLDQFACVDFDFVNDELRLDRNDPNPLISNMNDVVAQGALSLTKLRIYTADVTLDGRGPVKLLVDSGAASSFLNWSGVSDMKLSSSSPQIDPLREQIGAMGADNMALRLTHRYKVRRRWNLVAENNAVGDFCPGIGLGNDQFSDVDIGDLPVLEALKGDGAGGILGADLLMMCDVVRFRGLNGRSPTMILMKQ